MNLLTHNPEQRLSAKAKAFLARPKRLYINGQFVDAPAGETVETEDPALGTAITEVASAKREDIEKAAGAAREPDGHRLCTFTANLPELLPWLAPLFLDRSDDFFPANHPKTLRHLPNRFRNSSLQHKSRRIALRL